MKPIVMWLWGAVVASLWWATVTVHVIVIVPTVIASIATCIVFSIYLYNNWDKEE